MRRVALGVVAVGVVASVGLAGCQTPFQGGEIFIFDYQIIAPPAGQTSSDMAGALRAGARAAEMFDANQPVCRAAFSGDEAPEMNRGALPGDPNANISLAGTSLTNVSSLDPCGHDFGDLVATFGPPLDVGATTMATDFDLGIDATGTLEAFSADALLVTLTDFDAATLVYEGEFEAVATKPGDASRVLVISEGRFVLR